MSVGYRNPDAFIEILSYDDRGGSDGITPDLNPGSSYELMESIISISTAKSKSQPTGTFEIILAPHKNWVTNIAPGSWIVVHMSPERMTDEERSGSSEKTLRMIGRVDSVRVSVSIDQTTGARRTLYMVSGRDWGQVFESYLYVDAAAVSSLDQPLAKMTKLGFLSGNLSLLERSTNGLPSTTDLIDYFINLWGTSKSIKSDVFKSLGLDAAKYLPFSQFKIPNKLNILLDKKGASGNIADSIKIISGKLSGYNNYHEDTDWPEAVGGYTTQSITGANTLWQILNAHSCEIINEMFPELRWDGDKPSFALYKRIRPFSIAAPKASATDPRVIGGKIGPTTEKVDSRFFNVRRVDILKDDVISVEAGTNWRDSLNYIEVLPDYSFVRQGLDEKLILQNKENSAVYSPLANARDGLRIRLNSTPFLPPGSANIPDTSLMQEWLPILRGWYFDTHKMLNGTISIMGQPTYIGVGDNISFDATLIGDTSYISKQAENTQNKEYKVLAHIESVANSFSYLENGSRSYITTISFVRGIVVDSSCKKLATPYSYGIETYSGAIQDKDTDLKNVYGVIGEK